MNVLLDTPVLIDVLRARGGRRGALARLIGEGHTLATSAINIAEVYAGMRAVEESASEAFLSSLECYPVSRAIAQRAGRIKSDYALRGRTLPLVDMVIAATALEHDLMLLTDNRRDFALPELRSHLLPLPHSAHP